MDAGSVVYEVYGRRYRFERLRLDGGVLRGYCSKLRDWGTLFKTYIHLDSGQILPALKVG